MLIYGHRQNLDSDGPPRSYSVRTTKNQGTLKRFAMIFRVPSPGPGSAMAGCDVTSSNGKSAQRLLALASPTMPPQFRLGRYHLLQRGSVLERHLSAMFGELKQKEGPARKPGRSRQKQRKCHYFESGREMTVVGRMESH